MKGVKLLIGLMVLIMISSVSAIVEDSQVKVRDASNFDIYAPDMNFLNQNPDPAEPGGYVEVRIKIENIGIETATDMVFEIVPEYPFSLDPGSNGRVKLGDTDARQVGEEAYVLYWKLRIDKDAVEGNNRLKLRYSINNGAQWVDLEDWYIRIQTNDAIINVLEAVTEPDTIQPGDEFTLKITLENMADSLLKDVTLNVNLIHLSGATVVELPFTPLGASNEMTVKQLAAGEKKTISFDMIADVDATTGIYKVPIQLDYSDTLGSNYTKVKFIGARVGTEPDLFISVDRPSASSAGAETEMTVRFVNKGKDDLNFLFATIGEVEGLEVLSSRQVYIGSVDSDDFETEDFAVKAKNCDKTYEVPVKVEYESTSNEKFEEELTLEFMACTGSNGQKNGSSGLTGILIVIAIVIAAVVIYKFMRRKKE